MTPTNERKEAQPIGYGVLRGSAGLFQYHFATVEEAKKEAVGNNKIVAIYLTDTVPAAKPACHYCGSENVTASFPFCESCIPVQSAAKPVPPEPSEEWWKRVIWEASGNFVSTMEGAVRHAISEYRKLCESALSRVKSDEGMAQRVAGIIQLKTGATAVQTIEATSFILATIFGEGQ